ncbi:MAG: hypothetical protein AAGF01_00700 [Cyanobacteria bacterium P01_G01_bin.38]
MDNPEEKRPLEAQEIEITVPCGTSGQVRVVEADAQAVDDSTGEILVRVSRKRQPSSRPILGVIVK